MLYQVFSRNNDSNGNPYKLILVYALEANITKEKIDNLTELKYVLVIDTFSKLSSYPFNSKLDIETIEDEISELNSIAIAEGSSEFSYLGIKLTTIQSRYTNENYSIYTLKDWFNEYKIN